MNKNGRLLKLNFMIPVLLFSILIFTYVGRLSLSEYVSERKDNLAQVSGAGESPLNDSVPGSPVNSGSMRYYSNIYSIGIEWDLSGDENLDSVCSVYYRKSDSANWNQGAQLFRVKYAWYYNGPPTSDLQNGCYGSLMFLTPGTSYDVKVSLSDPDGGGDEKTFSISTRKIPKIPEGGNVYYVSSEVGEGDGSEANPFKGIAAAQAVARPKDIFILLPGDYGNASLSRGGDSSDNYVVWKGSSAGEVLFRTIGVSTSNIWIEGVSIRPVTSDNGSGIVGSNVNNVVVVKNKINNFGMGVRVGGNSEGWYIADNTIIGGKKAFNTPVMDPNATSGEGVELGESRGSHVVAWNSISRVGDGVSYPGFNCDIYGNDIFDTTDDAIEFDRGGANNRAWGNRMTNIGANVLSFQPMKRAPWYFIRNQIVASMHFDNELRFPAIFKFRVQDHFAFVNNTVVFGKTMSVYSDLFARSMTRNNLFISSTGNKPIWVATAMRSAGSSLLVSPSQRAGLDTKVDHNGYDWGSDTTRWDHPVFLWFDYYQDVKLNYSANLDEFYARYVFENSSKKISKESTFSSWNIPSVAERIEPSSINLSLSSGGQAIDSGVIIANLSDDFNGSAPDLGAIESGGSQPYYGVRNSESEVAFSNAYWDLDNGEQPPLPTPTPTPTPTPSVTPSPTPEPIHGLCGATNNSCTSGTLSDTTDSATNYLWSCNGSNGGNNASCTLPKNPNTPLNGSCGTTNNSCTAGTLSDSTDSSSHYLWSCVGLQGGTTASCQLVKPNPTPTLTPTPTPNRPRPTPVYIVPNFKPDPKDYPDFKVPNTTNINIQLPKSPSFLDLLLDIFNDLKTKVKSGVDQTFDTVKGLF